MEITVVVQAEIGLVIDAVKLCWSGFFGLMQIVLVIISLITTHAEVGFALLAQRRQTFNRVSDSYLGLHLVN